MGDDVKDGMEMVLGGLAVAVILIGGCISERHKEKYTAYTGIVDGQQVRYMEFSNRNEMEIKGENGTYRFIDSSEFHRLKDPLSVSDLLEKVEIDGGESTVKYERGNTNYTGLEKEVARDILDRSTRYYNMIRTLANDKGVLKLEDEEPARK